MKVMEARDPRVDPAFLDVVRSTKGTVRTVEFVTPLGTVVYSTATGRECQCKLKTWRRWAKGGSMKRYGSNPFQCEQALGMDHELEREVNALINRLTDGKVNRGEMLGALVEYGLAQLYRGRVAHGELRKCLKRYQERITRAPAGHAL